MKKFLLLIALPLTLVVILFHEMAQDRPTVSSDAATPSLSVAASSRPPASTQNDVPQSQWQYDNETDSLTDAKTARACIDSTNQLHFDFPYEGGSTGTLCFYKRAGRGILVNLRVDKGQFLCDISDGCPIAVRVNEGPVQHFSAGEPADDSSDVLVVNSGDRLLHTVTSGTRVRIAASFYQYGQQTFEFQPAGFDPKQFSLAR